MGIVPPVVGVQMVEHETAHRWESCVSIVCNRRIEGRVCTPESKPQFCRPVIVMGNAVFGDLAAKILEMQVLTIDTGR